jgi:release factor glutamine methyltransferase
MLSVNKKVFFDDFTFLVDENVYEPAEDSFLFAENLPAKGFCRVADVGTGCGILSIVAAKRAREIVGIDLNPYAVRCARQNAYLNGMIDKIVFIQGNLLSSIDQNVKFDLILFNAPYLPTERESTSWLERSWAGGETGRDIIDRFISEMEEHLSPNGQILLMQSSLSDIDQTAQRCVAMGLNPKIITRRSLPFFETIVLIKIMRQKESKKFAPRSA